MARRRRPAASEPAQHRVGRALLVSATPRLTTESSQARRMRVNHRGERSPSPAPGSTWWRRRSATPPTSRCGRCACWRKPTSIACEDTRVTAKLLAIHGISRPLVRYDEHTRAHGRAGADRADRRAASGWRWSPTPARRWSPIRASGWSATASTPACRWWRSPAPSAPLTALCVSRAAGRPLSVRRLPAAAATARRRELADARRRRGDAGAAGIAAAAGGGAGRHGGRAGRARRRGGARADQAVRGGAPRPAAAISPRTTPQPGAPKGEVTIVVAPPPPSPPVGDAEADRLLAEALARLSPTRRRGERGAG